MLKLFAKASNPAGWHMFTAAQNSQNEICIILKETADFNSFYATDMLH